MPFLFSKINFTIYKNILPNRIIPGNPKIPAIKMVMAFMAMWKLMLEKSRFTADKQNHPTIQLKKTLKIAFPEKNKKFPKRKINMIIAA